MPSVKFYWMLEDGTMKPIQEMDDGHLCRAMCSAEVGNLDWAMALVTDGTWQGNDLDVFAALRAELKRRGLGDPSVYRNKGGADMHDTHDESVMLRRFDATEMDRLGIGSIVMTEDQERRTVWVRQRDPGNGRAWMNPTTGRRSSTALLSRLAPDPIWLLVDIKPRANCDVCGQVARMENLCADHLTKILPPPVERAIVADVPPGPPPARYRPGGDGRQPLVVAWVETKGDA